MDLQESSLITSHRLHDNVQYMLILAFFILCLTYDVSISTQLPNGGLAVSLDNNFNPIRPCSNNSLMFGGFWSMAVSICELMNSTRTTYVAISPQLITSCRIGSGIEALAFFFSNQDKHRQQLFSLLVTLACLAVLLAFVNLVSCVVCRIQLVNLFIHVVSRLLLALSILVFLIYRGMNQIQQQDHSPTYLTVWINIVWSFAVLILGFQIFIRCIVYRHVHTMFYQSISD